MRADIVGVLTMWKKNPHNEGKKWMDKQIMYKWMSCVKSTVREAAE